MMHDVQHQDTSDTISPVYKATYQAGGHSNPNHVHSTLVTLIIIKFPMIGEVPKQFPSENGCILDVHNIDERNSSINYLFNMTKRRFYMLHYQVLQSYKRGSFELKSLVSQKCVVISRVLYKQVLYYDRYDHFVKVSSGLLLLVKLSNTLLLQVVKLQPVKISQGIILLSFHLLWRTIPRLK